MVQRTKLLFTGSGLQCPFFTWLCPYNSEEEIKISVLGALEFIVIQGQGLTGLENLEQIIVTMVRGSRGVSFLEDLGQEINKMNLLFSPVLPRQGEV